MAFKKISFDVSIKTSCRAVGLVEKALGSCLSLRAERVKSGIANSPACSGSLSGFLGPKCSGSVPRGVSGGLRAPGSGVSQTCPESVPRVSGTPF